MSESKICKNCGKKELLLDERRGQLCCQHCGRVQEENCLVTDIEFTSKGVQGQFVPKGGAACSHFGPSTFLPTLHDVDSFSRIDQKEAKKAKAHKLLRQLGKQLNIEDKYIEKAKRVFELAQESNFVQGRHATLVASAALYIICRQEAQPLMLLDFADAINVSLYSLAACYIKMVYKLNYSEKIPQIDPSLYIHRFCNKLEFGGKEREVAQTAMRLMQSFKRDWITQGRRPAGLCGAAIKIACSLHGFKRSTKQIINVVKVCEETVRKRIGEFKLTPLAQLPAAKLDSIDFKPEALPALDPPSFSKRGDLPSGYQQLTNSAEVQQLLQNVKSEMEQLLQEEEKSPSLPPKPTSQELSVLSEPEVSPGPGQLQGSLPGAAPDLEPALAQALRVGLGLTPAPSSRPPSELEAKPDSNSDSGSGSLYS
jgi:transcription factor IIIB subunit 2